MKILLPLEHENQGWDEKITNTIDDNDLDVEILYFTVKYTDHGCNSSEDDCDPLHGGLLIGSGVF